MGEDQEQVLFIQNLKKIFQNFLKDPQYESGGKVEQDWLKVYLRNELLSKSLP